MLVSEFLAKNKTVIMPQPPYLPDLASADFFLFPKLNAPKLNAEEKKAFCYDCGDEKKSKPNLLAISKNPFQKCFVDWKKRWLKASLI